MSICKLCLKKKDLIKKSHIIPGFMYQYLYDAKHRIIFTNTRFLLIVYRLLFEQNLTNNDPENKIVSLPPVLIKFWIWELLSKILNLRMK